jgi:hypothetical protein
MICLCDKSVILRNLGPDLRTLDATMTSTVAQWQKGQRLCEKICDLQVRRSPRLLACNLLCGTRERYTRQTAQSAHLPSRVLPKELDQQEDGPRLSYEIEMLHFCIDVFIYLDKIIRFRFFSLITSI